MKPCTRFHVEDVEPGDVVRILRDSEAEEPETVSVKVRRTYRSNRFGWSIEAEGVKDPIYLDDWDDVSLEQAVNAPALPPGSKGGTR